MVVNPWIVAPAPPAPHDTNWEDPPSLSVHASTGVFSHIWPENWPVAGHVAWLGYRDSTRPDVGGVYGPVTHVTISFSSHSPEP